MKQINHKKTHTVTDIEYKKRFDLVLGIAVAGFLSFLINIFSSIYYDVFLTHSKNISQYESNDLIIFAILFSATIAFLQFLIIDYKNEIDLKKGFWKRYLFFFMHDFVVTRAAVHVYRFFLGLTILLIDIAIVMTIPENFRLWAIAVICGLGVLVVFIRDKIKIHNKKIKHTN